MNRLIVSLCKQFFSAAELSHMRYTSLVKVTFVVELALEQEWGWQHVLLHSVGPNVGSWVALHFLELPECFLFTTTSVDSRRRFL